MRWIALNRREWPKVAPSKPPCCTDWYSALWLDCMSLYIFMTMSSSIALSTFDVLRLLTLIPENPQKSISHMDLWMLWIQVPSPPPALQHKSLEQYVIWTTAPHWSVEPDDGWAWLSPQTNWCWSLIPYSHLFPGYEFRSCWQTNMPHWHCKHIGHWRAVQSVHLREEWGHVWTSIMCGHMMRHISIAHFTSFYCKNVNRSKGSTSRLRRKPESRDGTSICPAESDFDSQKSSLLGDPPFICHCHWEGEHPNLEVYV